MQWRSRIITNWSSIWAIFRIIEVNVINRFNAEFEYINVDKEREAFNLKKLNNPEYLEKILRDIVNIELYFRKDDLITQIQRKKMVQ